MKVAAVQHDIVWEEPRANFERLAPLVTRASDEGARLVLLTEMCTTGFSMDAGKVAEPFDGRSAKFLREQAAANDVWVGGSVPEVQPGHERPSNTFVLGCPDGSVHRYCKIHPFSYSGEDDVYDAGDRLVTVDVDGVRVSLFVCYDLRFADEFWAVARDTDCYLVPANWPEQRRDHWRALLRARAIENLAYVVGANRVGRGGKADYVGDSAIVGPFGEELADGADAGETILYADIDPDVVSRTRQRYPFLADRRS